MMVKKMGYSNIMIFSLALYSLRILGYSLFTKPGNIVDNLCLDLSIFLLIVSANYSP